MSFDVNIGRAEPVIKAAAGTNNDGGSGGNLGYMMGGGRQKKKDEQESVFKKDQKEVDSFEFSTLRPYKNLDGIPTPPQGKSGNWLQRLINKIS